MGTNSRVLQLINLDATTGMFEVCEEASAVLAGMGDNPIAVVSVAGASRTGKSYMLNKLAGRAGGFKVSPHTKPCTHGIWLSVKEVQAEQGPDHTMVSEARRTF
jgi:hypothetical protein